MATGSVGVSAEVVRGPKLLQVCNVGRIVGGTAACAWSVTRALPHYRHHVLFLSPPDRMTADAFAPVTLTSATTVTRHDIERLQPDMILLHNVSAARIVRELPVPTLLYLHSAIPLPAAADLAVCCSSWLAQRVGMPRARVLWQGVEDCAPRCVAANQNRGLLVVGRICTPTAQKWPRTVVPFYAELAARCPHIAWEFVGCPAQLETELRVACRERVQFHPAGWHRRELLSRWDVLLYSNPALPESFGRTAAEAMRAGCIPVVDRLGGFVEQIPPDCGFLCETIDEFANALQQLAEGQVRRAMSEQSRQHAQTWFSLPRFGADLVWLFAEAIETFNSSQ